MNKSFIFFFLIFFTSFPSWSSESKHLLKPKKTFTEYGVITTENRNIIKPETFHTIETGLINNVPYKFSYTDGRGKFGQWEVGCKKDPITDVKNCYTNNGKIWIKLKQNKQFEVYISTARYGRTNVIVRVDQYPIISTTEQSNGVFTALQSAVIIQQMQSGTTITSRSEWPHNYQETETVELIGFQPALQYVIWALSTIE